MFSSRRGTLLYLCIFILAGHCYTSLAVGQALWADVTRTEDRVVIPKTHEVWHDDIFFYIPISFLIIPNIQFSLLVIALN